MTYTPRELSHLKERLRWTSERLSPKFQTPNQVLGRKRTIGCVALEITQRCNLDCSICYLSPESESTPDLPLEEIFRRIERIREDYGVGTNVQITGGDPTLRDHDELEQIVRYCVANKLVPALFTNGVHATRELLQRLTHAGLVDVAFHVDLTEKRKGYRTEIELNEVRREYIERARGLGLNVIFNQTVFKHNFRHVPELVRFYAENADVVGMASFQLQADTGRGANRRRNEEVITLDTVSEKIMQGTGTSLSFESVKFGHPSCHRIAYAAVFGKGDHVADIFDDPDVVAELIDVFDDLWLDRRHPRRAAMQAVTQAFKRGWVRRGVGYFGSRLLRNWRPLLKSGGRVRKLSFFMQNFQNAHELDPERIDNCSFHCITSDGGVSMCVHNAYREHYIAGGTGIPDAYYEQVGRPVPEAAK